MNGEQLCSSSSSSSGFCGVLRVSSSHDRYTLDSARTFLTVIVCRSISYMFLVFAARCYACAVLAIGLCVSVSLCVCVCHKSVFYYHHHHDHFICPIIQQYTDLHGYGLEEQDSKVR